MIKTLLSTSVVALGIAGAMLPATSADAREGRHGAFAAGAAAGVVGGALLGSAASRPRYEAAPVYDEPRCYWRRERIRDDYGVRVRRVQICD
jgi:hypothetical protein